MPTSPRQGMLRIRNGFRQIRKGVPPGRCASIGPYIHLFNKAKFDFILLGENYANFI